MAVVPAREPELAERVPAEIVVVPVKVLAPEMLQVLLPVLVNEVVLPDASVIVPESTPA